MAASYVVYVDESGDEGFVFNEDLPGSSKWFVLSAVVIRKALELDTAKLLDEYRARMRWVRKPIHFRNLKHESRLPLVDLISKARVRVLVVAIHKPSLKEPEKFQKKSVLYHYATRFLLERVSWCCRDYRRNDDDGDGSAELVFSHRTGTSYPELAAYFERLRRKSEVEDVQIDWGIINPNAVRAVNHDAMMGLQIADACASAFFYGLEPNPQGFNEPRYSAMLKPVVYGRRGQRIGYGVKLWPRETDALLASDSRLTWVREIFK